MPGRHGHTKHAVVVSAHTPLQQLLPSPHSASVIHPQRPFVHAPLFGHATPQAPQFGEVLSAVSQPSAARLLQSANPESHCPKPHIPLLHWPAAWAGAHARLQAPQSVRLFNERSQPSAGSPLQSAKPGRHMMLPHTPALQAAEATFANLVQLFLQLPQLAGFDRSASQPLPGIPSQFARPLSHTRLHVPSSQLELTTSISEAHTLLQPPHVAGRPKSDSHPSPRLLLQLPRPSVQRVI